jgi:phage tail sheath protein FI
MTQNDTTVLVPPAADISNSFVRKFLGGDPFAIVANKNGIISNPDLAGVEYMLDAQDRNFLEPFGYNSIIERTSTGEIMIYGNRTAFQTVKSDYNYLHVRELLNTIELQVEEVLKNFVFDYNNPVTRLTIVNAITPILQSIKDAGALSNYEIVMDETNNTAEIVDEGFAIIDIGVWVTKGMEKIIQRITVNKTGGASSGGFTTA